MAYYQDIFKKYGLNRIEKEHSRSYGQIRAELEKKARGLLNFNKNAENGKKWLSTQQLKDSFSIWKDQLSIQNFPLFEGKILEKEEKNRLPSELYRNIRLGYDALGSQIVARVQYGGEIEIEKLQKDSEQESGLIVKKAYESFTDEQKMMFVFDKKEERRAIEDFWLKRIEECLNLIEKSDEIKKMTEELIQENLRIINDYERRIRWKCKNTSNF